MREPTEPALFRSETGQKLLRHKGIMESEVIRRPGSCVMDLAALKEQAERCRRLAKQADPFTQKRLLDLAAEYEAQIANLEPQPSAGSLNLRNGEP